MFTIFHARWVAAGLVALALPLHAQQRTADDPRADVPAIDYQPAYAYAAAPLDATTPERNWQAANRTVAGAAPNHAHHAHHTPQAPQAHPAAPAKKDDTKDEPEHHHHGEHHP